MSNFVLYFAGAENLEIPITSEDNCGKLFTFALKPKKLNAVLEGVNCKTFIDSGAFSMYHSGVKIDIDEYIEYINNTPKPTVWAELDTIPYPILDTASAKVSAEESWEKYIYMIERIKDEYIDKIMPVYHFGEPYAALERMLNTEVKGRLIPYICLGGRHGVNRQAHDKYYSHLFKIIKASKNPNVKVHALGMTVLDLLEKYPFYSADSTTWLMLGANGNLQTKTCGTISVSEVKKHDTDSAWHLPKDMFIKLNNEVEEKGFTLEELSKNYRERHKFNALYYKDWANNYKYKGQSGITRRRLF
jgi:hypothetical protein